MLAYGAGGALETVEDGLTGLFFQHQSVESIIEAVECFEEGGVSYSAAQIRQAALRFSQQRFIEEFSALVDGAIIEER